MAGTAQQDDRVPDLEVRLARQLMEGVQVATGALAGLQCLGEATNGVTQPVDEAVGGALNEVGGAVGQPDLGDQVGGAVDGVTDQVGGAVDGVVP